MKISMFMIHLKKLRDFFLQLLKLNLDFDSTKILKQMLIEKLLFAWAGADSRIKWKNKKIV